MILLGIDPGTATTGFGVIEAMPGTRRLIDCGVITTDKSLTDSERLAILYDDLSAVIAQHQPEAAAVEKLFFATNVTTAMTVSQARGVILLALVQAKLNIQEYTPLQIKQAVTGYGQAKKAQMQELVKMQLSLTSIPKPDDAADAVAVALTLAAHLKV